jgi:hypothetical protein
MYGVKRFGDGGLQSSPRDTRDQHRGDGHTDSLLEEAGFEPFVPSLMVAIAGVS